jgi:hypothetical protein
MGNTQGSYYFLKLNFGKTIIRNTWTMHAEVIATVHQLSSASKNTRVVITDKDGNVMDDT